MLNLNEARDLARDFYGSSVIITDYLRAIYVENSLIDGREREGQGGERKMARTWEEKKGEL